MATKQAKSDYKAFKSQLGRVPTSKEFQRWPRPNKPKGITYHHYKCSLEGMDYKTFVRSMGDIPIGQEAGRKPPRWKRKKVNDVNATGKIRPCNVCGDDFEQGATWLRCPSCDDKVKREGTPSDFAPESNRYSIGYSKGV